MDLQLKNQVAFLAGSSRGLGKAIAAALLREGCRVCITGRGAASLDLAAEEMAKSFGKENILKLPGDFTDGKIIAGALDNVVKAWGSLDILIANIGSGIGKPGWQQTDGEWERLFNVNLFGSVRLAQTAIPHMQQRGGSIIFISSIVGVEATAAPLPYSAAKSALISYSKNLARTVAEYKIRVNCIAPGNIFFPGGSWDRHLESRRESVLQYIASEVPLKRFGTPEEIANMTILLASPVSGFATGGCYIVDGGQTRTM